MADVISDPPKEPQAMSETLNIQALVAQRPPEEQAAIYLVVCMISQYGRGPGTGLFTGVARYQVLQARLEQAAVGARDLPDFWARTCRFMRWPIGTRAADAAVLTLFAQSQSAPVLNVLRQRLVAVIMIARAIAAADRAVRQELAKALSAEIAAMDAADDEAATDGAALDDGAPDFTASSLDPEPQA